MIIELKQRDIVALLKAIRDKRLDTDDILMIWGDINPIVSKGFNFYPTQAGCQIAIQQAMRRVDISKSSATDINQCGDYLQLIAEQFCKEFDMFGEEFGKQINDVLQTLGNNL